MRYWKIAAGEGAQNIDDFKTKEIVAVGFVHKRSVVDARTVGEIRRMVAEEHPDASPGRIGVQGSMLFRFYHDIRQGDRVLVYEPDTRLYHIGEIISDAEYKEGESLPHVRNVKWLSTLSRDTLTVPTRHALGAISTLFEVAHDAKEEIKERLAGRGGSVAGKDILGEEQQEDVYIVGESIEKQAQEFIKDALVKIDPYQMQDLVAGLLRAMGYKTRVSPPGPDRGRDIHASPDGLGLEDPRIVVQVKHRPDTRVSADEMRAFATVVRNTQAKGLYVSTGGFSRDARALIDSPDTSLIPIDFEELIALVIQYYDQCDMDTKALLPLRKIYWPTK